MIIGITGAHRVGKTSLAQSLADHIDGEFIQTHVSNASFWKENFISPDIQVTYSERVFLQSAILKHFKTIITRRPTAHKHVIYDRSFLDVLGYLYANIDHTTSELSKDTVTEIIMEAIYLQNTVFDLTFYMYPGIPVASTTDKTGKTFLSSAYIQAVGNNILASGIQYSHPSKFVCIPLDLVTIMDRRRWVSEYIDKNI